MEQIPTLPVSAPGLVGAPTHIAEKLFAEREMKKTMTESQKEVRKNRYGDAFNQWSNNKLTDLRFTQIIDELGQESDTEIEKQYWQQTLRATKTDIHTKNLERMKGQIDLELAKDSLSPIEAYNKISELSRLAAGLGLPDISASYLLDAQITLNTMLRAEEAERKALEAEVRANYNKEINNWADLMEGILGGLEMDTEWAPIESEEDINMSIP